MQSIKNIYEKIYDFENLHKAWEEARKGKRYRDDVLIFNRNYEEQLINIQNHLIYETYEVGKYHTFYVYEPKKRRFTGSYFRCTKRHLSLIPTPVARAREHIRQPTGYSIG